MRRLQERSGVPDALWRLAEVLADVARNTPEGDDRENKRRAFPVNGIRSGSQACGSRHQDYANHARIELPHVEPFNGVGR